MSDSQKSDMQILADMVRQNQQAQLTREHNSPLGAKNINALVIAAIIGGVAFLWTSVTEQPKQSAEQYTQMSTQTAEIRTTVMQLRTSMTELNTKLDNQVQQAQTIRSTVDRNAAEIDAMKNDLQQNRDRIISLERAER